MPRHADSFSEPSTLKHDLAEIAQGLLWLAIAVAAVALLLSFIGCQQAPAPDHGAPTGEGITLAQGHVTAAQADLTTAKRFTGKPGVPFIELAEGNLNSSLKAMSQALDANEKNRQDAKKLEAEGQQKSEEIARLGQELKDEQAQVFGKWTRDRVKLLATIAVLTWIGVGAIGMAGPAGIGTSFVHWGSTIIRAIPLGNIFAWLRDRLTKPPAATV